MQSTPDLIGFLGNNAPIIINTDIDGILSGLLLTAYCGAKVVGFCNSSDTVWVNSDYATNLNQCIFIDMYVPMAGYRCIDQHIIAVNDTHSVSLVEKRAVLNPNLEQFRTFTPSTSYVLKYPFSTTIYILSLLKAENIESPINFDGCVHTSTIIDFILRADDTLWTTVGSSYARNAAEWWAWLGRNAFAPQLIDPLRQATLSTSRHAAQIKKSSLASVFRRFGCERPDGGTNRICNSDGRITDGWRGLCSSIGTAIGVGYVGTEGRFVTRTGETRRLTPTARELRELQSEGKIDGRQVFSYAFVRSPNSPANLSLTFALQ